MKAFMYLVGYDHSFMKFTNSGWGWGCGYVAMKEDHQLVFDYKANITKQVADNNEAEKLNPDHYSWIDDYLQLKEFEQKITYTEWREINGIKYLVIGFDTAHSYNDPTDHTMDYVLSETVKILNIVNSYE